MRRWWNHILLAVIIAITAFSVVTVWPGEPDKYLPDFVPWPEGRGIELSVPTITGGTFDTEKIERREMSLGLDLRGGTRLVLEPEEGAQVEDLDEALKGAQRVIERRVNEFGVAESEVNRLGDNRIAVQLPGITPEEAVDKIGRTALLQFCEPVQDTGGNVAVAREGTVQYQPQTCDPVRNEQGDIAVQGGQIEYAPYPPSDQSYTHDQIVWQPAKGDLNGRETALTGEFLRPNTYVTTDQTGLQLFLVYELNNDGADLSEEITTRLIGYPVAPFLDGEPILGENGTIIAPIIQGTISQQGQITGLSRGEAQELSRLLNTGAFPVPLRVVQQQTVDATLGETAVRDSVIAGEVALLLIMVFMILYYRLPGIMASLALVVYTSLVLAVFKLWPVTLTLSGVAAFVLSVGMAVDANILIFERMKEELRVGRNLVAALEDGFNRAWSSIRDSNVSTLITCAILYWFGNQFDEAAIKGFAITLAIGVLVSMFSAITVTRTFMRLIVSFRPLTRRLWLFVADAPQEAHREARRVPAIAGGSGKADREEGA
jgi:preprotein translocase subunit SecD